LVVDGMMKNQLHLSMKFEVTKNFDDDLKNYDGRSLISID